MTEYRPSAPPGHAPHWLTRALKAVFRGGVCILFAGLLAACAVTPEPISDNQRKTRADQDLEYIAAKRFAPSQPISLYEAMARAVAFNLQHGVRQIERDIAELELEQQNLEGMPDIGADAGYNRDSVVTSTDTDRNIRSVDVRGTWNVLDLGVSYARAQQSADRVLIAEERRRKALQDIIRNVRLAYWKAVGAQRLMARMVAVESDFSSALAESRRLEVRNVETRRRTIGFRRGLIDTVRQLIAARKEYSRAKLEFAQLINIRPGVRFSLQPPEKMQGIPALPMAVSELEAFALANRPELRVEDYNERVSDWESREALYSMFPGLDLNLARNYSSNNGLVNSTWTGAGLQLGMTMFRLFSGPLRMQAAEQRGELARRQRLALSVAVLAQVHIAYHDYSETKYQFRLARQISRSDRELSNLALAERRITNGNQLNVIDVAARQLRSEVEQHRAYVELRRAYGDLLHSLGLDVIPLDVPLNDVDGLRTVIRHTMAKWETLTVDTDPANDGSIEELMGQVMADVRRDVNPSPDGLGGGRTEAPSFLDLEMQGTSPLPTALVAAASGPADTPGGGAESFETAILDGALPAMAKAAADAGRHPAPARVASNDPVGRAVRQEPRPATTVGQSIEDAAGELLAEVQQDIVVPAEQGAGTERLSFLDLEMQGGSPLPAFAVAAAPGDVPADRTTGTGAESFETAILDRALPAMAEAAADTATKSAPAMVASNADAGQALAPPLPREKKWLPTYDVQFGAFKEYKWAHGLVGALQDLHRPQDADRHFRIVRKWHPGKAALFHVQYGAYLGWTAAQQACNKFAARGKKCVVVRHSAATSAELNKQPATRLADTSTQY